MNWYHFRQTGKYKVAVKNRNAHIQHCLISAKPIDPIRQHNFAANYLEGAHVWSSPVVLRNAV